MKRIFSLILALAMVFLLCGCCIIHKWEDATCTEPKTCSKCGKTEGAALGHDFSKWETETEPTYLIEGLQTRECKTCGETEEEAIDKLDIRNCRGADSDGFTVSSEEFFYLTEEILNGNTSYMDSTAKYSLSDTSAKGMKELYVNGSSSGIFLLASLYGEETDENDTFDNLGVVLLGDSDTIDRSLSEFQAAAISVILLTNPDVSNKDDALDYFNSVIDYYDSNNNREVFRNNALGYLLNLDDVGGGAYILSFIVRIPEHYE